MKIGIVGLPNKGKSTFFSCLTKIKVDIADYPFTTIEPNTGIGYIVVDCACKHFNVSCKPKTKCINGKRFVPVNLVDIAGIVKDAHLGKGLGNYFLDRIRDADALLQVIDISGNTDLSGNKVIDNSADPEKEVSIFKEEFVKWVEEILKKHQRRFRQGKEELRKVLSGLNFNEYDTDNMIKKLNLEVNKLVDDDNEVSRVANYVYDRIPKALIANKMDLGKAKENFQRMKNLYDIYPTILVAELYARRLEEENILEITDSIKQLNFNVDKDLQKKIDILTKIFSGNEVLLSTQVLTDFVINKMNYIVVFPVEDEHKLSDSKGNILPDAFLLKKGSTAIDLANAIHSDLAKNLITAVDVRRKINISKDHELKHLDVIKLVTGK
ncbi:MAG: 50S ribosome-binding GTPase [Candidatus Micrarchaeota archaeon]|nr:50S ribosome-binding GTPase [Candidatus Micrarchaeota archaeon]